MRLFFHSVQKKTAVVIVGLGLLFSSTFPLNALAKLPANLKQYTLPSGQRLLVVENHNQPIVTIDTWVSTGSVNEVEANNGVSHFLEHLLFKGTDKLAPRELERQLDSQGASFNAATSQDFTHYYLTIPSSFFEEALELHANMLQRAVIPPDELKQERLVVQEEINRAEGRPKAKLFELLDKTIYPSHGYGQTTLGPKETIASIPRQSIVDYYQHWYRPTNFVTLVTGDVEAEDVLTEVQQAFKANEASVEEQSKTYTPPKVSEAPDWQGPKVALETQAGLSQAYGILVLPAPSLMEPLEETIALDAGMTAWGGDSSSRLVQSLLREQQLVQSISAGNSTQRYAGLAYVLFTTTPENFEQAVTALLQEWQSFRQEGLTQAEWQRLQEQFEKDFIFLTEDNESLANTLGYYASIGRVEDVTEYLDVLQNQELETVNHRLKAALSTDTVALTALLPENSVLAKRKKTLQHDLMKQLKAASKPVTEPATLKERDDTLEASASNPVAKAYKLEQTILNNGITLLSKPLPNQQTFSVKLFIPGGQWTEKVAGLNTLLAQTWVTATEHYSEANLQKTLNKQGIKLGVSPSDNALQISLTATEEDLGEALLLLNEVLFNPAFDPVIVEREKQRLLQAIDSAKDSPASQAMMELEKALYPVEHPYGHTGDRLKDTLPSLSAEDLKAAHKQLLTGQRWIVSAAGNYDEAMLLDILSTWPVEAKKDFNWTEAFSTAPELPPTQGETVAPKRPDQPAYWMAWGWRVPGLQHPDAGVMRVINGLLGQGMSSRLFVELREKHGLAYAVSSAYPLQLKDGKFVTFIGTDASKKEAAVKGLKEQVKRLIEEPVEAEELERIKSKLIGQFRLAHNGPGNLAYYPGFYETVGLGASYEQEFESLIEAVTAEDVQRVAKQYLSAEPVRVHVGP